MIIFTEIVRNSFKYSKDVVKNLKFNRNEMEEITSYVDEAYKLLNLKSFQPQIFGELLDNYWAVKKKLSKKLQSCN